MDWDLIAADDYLTGESDRRNGKKAGKTEMAYELIAKLESKKAELSTGRMSILKQGRVKGLEIAINEIKDALRHR